MNEVFNESLEGYPEPDLLSSKGNISLLAKNLTRVLTDAKLRERIQFWDNQHIKTFSWEKTAAETFEFYKQFLPRNKAI